MKKEEEIRLYLKELGINDNAGELSELTEKLMAQEGTPYDYEENFFVRLEELGSYDDPKPLTGDLYEHSTYLGEYFPLVVLSQKGWPLHFDWTIHPDSVEQDVQNQAKKITSVKISEEGYTRKIAEDWVEGQIKTFEKLHGYKPYLQGKILV